MSTINIILPTYNSTRIIEPTLASLFDQTHQDFKLLIVDDGSTDNTVEMMQKIRDPRVSVHAFPNAGVGGPSVSRNRGLALADGDYIALMNHDDLWSADKLERQLDALHSTPDAMVAYSWLDHIDIDGKFLHRGSHSNAVGKVYSNLLQGNFIETGSNPLIRREAFAVVGGFDPAYRLVADWEMWLRLAKRFKFVNVPKVQVFFRDLPEALSANTPRMEQDGLRLFRHIYAHVPTPLSSLQSLTLGNYYEYLASRTLKGVPSPNKGRLALQFLKQAMEHDSSMLWRKSRRVLTIMAKASANLCLSQGQIDQAMTLYRNHIQ